MARSTATEPGTAVRLILNIRSLGLTDDQFFQLCRDNRDLRIEMTAQEELIVMSPTNPETGRKSATFTARLWTWTQPDGTGVCFDSSAEFTLLNGAKRSPDAAWILKSRWEPLSKEERGAFTRICPDFVIELRSPSDRLADLEEKMEEYIANGAQLGWLLVPIENRATIYRPNQSRERIDSPAILTGESVLPGFTLDFREIL